MKKFNSIGTCIEINKNIVTINKNYESIKVMIINMQELEFDCERKKSSVIYYVPNEKKHYIVTKGSIKAIESIIKSSDKLKFNDIVEQFNNTFLIYGLLHLLTGLLIIINLKNLFLMKKVLNIILFQFWVFKMNYKITV